MLTESTIKKSKSDVAVRRVAYVHDTNVYGGVEVFLLDLMKYLDPARYKPVVVIPGYSDEYRGSPLRFTRNVEKADIPIIKLPDIRKNSPVSFWQEINEIKNIFKKEQIDVMHIHTCRPLGARKATIGAWLAGVPARVRTEHGPPLGVNRFTPYFVKPFDLMTDYILTVSDATLEDQVKETRRSRKKLYRSYGGIELADFKPDHDVAAAKRQIGLDSAIPVVGSVGRLSEEKGHTYLIKAVEKVIKDFGPVNFVLVGEGPLEESLRKQAAQSGLSEYIHIAGYQPNRNLYMQAMDIGVMPSVQEGLGLALLEFMALGKPTVTSTVPCFNEVIENGRSGIIASLEGDALANAILTLLNNPQLAAEMGQAALQRVRAHFSVQRLANDMMGLYDKLLNPG